MFYNKSAFDGRAPIGDFRGDAAVATDKVALRPGQRATFANYTSYRRGINGVIVDLDEPAERANAIQFHIQGRRPRQ